VFEHKAAEGLRVQLDDDRAGRALLGRDGEGTGQNEVEVGLIGRRQVMLLFGSVDDGEKDLLEYDVGDFGGRGGGGDREAMDPQ